MVHSRAFQPEIRAAPTSSPIPSRPPSWVGSRARWSCVPAARICVVLNFVPSRSRAKFGASTRRADGSPPRRCRRYVSCARPIQRWSTACRTAVVITRSRSETPSFAIGVAPPLHCPRTPSLHGRWSRPKHLGSGVQTRPLEDATWGQGSAKVLARRRPTRRSTVATKTTAAPRAPSRLRPSGVLRSTWRRTRRLLARGRSRRPIEISRPRCNNAREHQCCWRRENTWSPPRSPTSFG